MGVRNHPRADFVSGAGELTAAGAQLGAPAGSELALAHCALADGGERHPG